MQRISNMQQHYGSWLLTILLFIHLSEPASGKCGPALRRRLERCVRHGACHAVVRARAGTPAHHQHTVSLMPDASCRYQLTLVRLAPLHSLNSPSATPTRSVHLSMPPACLSASMLLHACVPFTPLPTMQPHQPHCFPCCPPPPRPAAAAALAAAHARSVRQAPQHVASLL